MTEPGGPLRGGSPRAFRGFSKVALKSGWFGINSKALGSNGLQLICKNRTNLQVICPNSSYINTCRKSFLGV